MEMDEWTYQSKGRREEDEEEQRSMMLYGVVVEDDDRYNADVIDDGIWRSNVDTSHDHQYRHDHHCTTAGNESLSQSILFPGDDDDDGDDDYRQFLREMELVSEDIQPTPKDLASDSRTSSFESLEPFEPFEPCDPFKPFESREPFSQLRSEITPKEMDMGMDFDHPILPSQTQSFVTLSCEMRTMKKRLFLPEVFGEQGWFSRKQAKGGCHFMMLLDLKTLHLEAPVANAKVSGRIVVFGRQINKKHAIKVTRESSRRKQTLFKDQGDHLPFSEHTDKNGHLQLKFQCDLANQDVWDGAKECRTVFYWFQLQDICVSGTGQDEKLESVDHVPRLFVIVNHASFDKAHKLVARDFEALPKQEQTQPCTSNSVEDIEMAS